MNTLLQKDPQDLSLHPLAKLLPHWAKDDPRFERLCDAIRERGIAAPILVDAEHRILIGENIWRAAKQLQLTEVPVIEVKHGPVVALVDTLLLREHFTLGQRAFISYPLLADAHEEARTIRLEMLKKGNVSPKYTECTTGKKVEDFAAIYGFSRITFFQAAALHKHFSNPAQFSVTTMKGTVTGTLREIYEPLILDEENPYGLGAVLAGIASVLRHDGNPAQTRDEQLELFSAGLDFMRKRFRYWPSLSPEQRKTAINDLRGFIAAMPEDMLAETATAIRLARRVV